MKSVESDSPKLSVCICVDNSNQDVKRAIESVREIAGEIILVESCQKSDTPPSGKLIEVAKEYGAGYFCKDFGGDLSAFRNAAYRIAENEFVLFIDPDEEFPKDEYEKIEKLITAKHYDVFYTKIINYDANGDVVSFYYRPRLFRTNAGFYFSGEFIPKLTHNNKEKYTNISIQHFGYALEKEKLAVRNFINQKLFKKQVSREPDNPYCYFYAAEGSELVCDFDIAKENLAKAVKIISDSSKATPEQKALLAECYYALARIALSTKNSDEALKNALSGYEAAKNNININFILGEVFFALTDYESAYKHYLSYLEFRDMVDQIEVKNAFMVFDAAYYVNFMIGKTLMSLGRIDEALTFFEKSLEIKPDYASTLNELGCLYQIKEDIPKAKEYFEKAFKVDENLAEAVCNLGVVSFLDEPEKGLKLIQKALDMQPDNYLIKEIYQSYYANKDRILEKRRISVCINTLDCSSVKETIKSAFEIADEFIVLIEKGDVITQEDLDGKKYVPLMPEAEMKLAARKNVLIDNANLDWVFFINEGESIRKEDLEGFVDLTKKKDVDLFYLNVTDSGADNSNGVNTTRYEPRLFRKGDAVLYDETVFDDIKHSGKSEFSDVTLYKAGMSNTKSPLFQLRAKAYHDELSVSPRNCYARFMLGKMFYIAKDFEKALAEFELAKSCEGSLKDGNTGFMLESSYLLGCIYMGLKKPVKARDTFKDIIKKDKVFIDAYFQLGYISCFNNEDPNAGIKCLDNYFSLLGKLDTMDKRALLSCHTTKSQFKAYYYRGVLCQKVEEFDKAGDSFKKAIKANPGYLHPYINMANLLVNNDDLKGAKDYLAKAASIDANNYSIHQQLAAIHVREKDFDSAKAELEKCLAINADSIETLSLLGRIHEETMNFAKAEQCYRSIVDKQPQDKNAILKLGDILFKKDDPTTALKVFRDLLAMKPSFIPANISVGNVLIQMDNLGEAEAHFNKLMKEYPDVAEYVLYASKVAISKKNFGDALTYFDKLLQINPKSEGYVKEQKKLLKEKGII